MIPVALYLMIDSTSDLWAPPTAPTVHYKFTALPTNKIYPKPAARGTYDSQGRLAGYCHGDEEVPQFAEQEDKYSELDAIPSEL